MKHRQGCILTNGYIRRQKFDEITYMYIEAAKKKSIGLRHITTDKILHGMKNGELLLQGININDMDFVLFLDKDIRLARALERQGIRLFNASKVIEVCDDKSATFFELANAGIPMPKTIVAPLVFPGTYKEEDSFIDYLEEELSYPIIIKESFGSFGEQVYMVSNKEELQSKRKELATLPHIYQEFISSSKGRDVRVNVVGEHVVASMKRKSTTDFRANISSGGSMEPISLPKAFEEMAFKVASLLGADFAGVDILFGKDEEPLLCEVNSNAHIKNILECTGINVADAIITHIEKEVYYV